MIASTHSSARADLVEAAASRVRELAKAYEPPAFGEAPGPDAALFLCAIDHRTGYRRPHRVGGGEPLDGSDLLWNLGCAAERRRPGALSAEALAQATVETVERMFRAGEETVAGAEDRARLWRDLAGGLLARYEGSASRLINASARRLEGPGGLIARLAEFEAFADPLRKKGFLFAKIAARRGWFAPRDPEAWQVCADNVLMRLALRSGLVRPDPDPGRVRAATREVFRQVAAVAEIAPPLLDDMLWELGRRDADLLGAGGGADLSEPPRPDGMLWY